nr:DeoR/GlpR family DNA-binding transcription regulator [uncultured Massilia sp.]
MLKQERQQFILARLGEHGQVQLGALSRALQVSEDTVRRDIDELERQGLLSKVRGGALPSSPIPDVFGARERHDAAAKQDIARKARTLVGDGQLIVLDGGTTVAWLARALAPMRRLTVATNSLPAANVLLEHPGVEVRLAGGLLHAPYRVTLGSETVDFFRQVRADVCFLGAYGLHPEVGLTVASAEEAAVKRAMLRSAAHVVALVTPEKLGTAAPYVVCAADAIHTLVTADDVAPSVTDAYRALGVDVP